MSATGEGRSPRFWLVLGLAVGVLGIAVRLWLYQQPVNSDDVQYFTLAAAEYNAGNVVRAGSVNGLRAVLLLVPEFFVAILGTSWVSFYATVYFFACLSFASLFCLAWLWSGRRVAVIVAVIWALSYASVAVDTRLTPDNFGTALALFGLALIALATGVRSPSSSEAAPLSARRIIVYALLAGLLLWAAFSVRASFFIFGVAGGILTLFARRWLFTASFVLAGLLLGAALELLFFELVLGEPLERWKVLLGFQSGVAASGAAGVGAYAGYDVSDLFVRYPVVLARSHVGETVLHVIGLIGVMRWTVGWRDPCKRAKALCAWLAYGFLAFAVANVDPVVPLMREKFRYYATAAPLFHLAVAELIDTVVFGDVARRITGFGGRAGQWVAARLGTPGGTRLGDRIQRHAHRAPYAISSIIVLALLFNACELFQEPIFARNGNDGSLVAADFISDDAGSRSRPRRFYCDDRTGRLINILLPRDDGWRHVNPFHGYDTELHIAEDGYLVLDWKRLNGNVSNQYDYGPQTHALYRMLEVGLLVGRHRNAGDLVDVFYLGPRPIERRRQRLPHPFPERWSRMIKTESETLTREWQSLSAADEVAFEHEDPADRYWEFIYQGDGRVVEEPPTSLRIAGDRFVQIVVRARADHAKVRELRAYLYWWPEELAKNEKPRLNQYMGRVGVPDVDTGFGFWTYLPRAARAHRIVFRAQSGIALSDVAIFVLDRHEGDRIQQDGGAW